MSTFRLLPFTVALLAGGCVTDYGYHQGGYSSGGDYYVGTPRIAYDAPYGAYPGYTPYIDPGLYGYGYGWYGWYRGSAYPGPYPYPGGHPYWSAAYRGGPWGGGSYWGGYRLHDPYWGNPHWRTTYGGGGYWGPSIHHRQFHGGGYYGGGYYGGPYYGGPIYYYHDRKPNRPAPPPTHQPYVHRMNPRDGVVPPRVVRPPSTVVRPRPTAVTPPPASPSTPPRTTPIVPSQRPTSPGVPARERVRVKTVDPRVD
jgi:hypothetical protein